MASEYGPPELWRSYNGITWDGAPTNTENAASLSVNAPIAGLHFGNNGRAFVSTPRVVSKDLPATLNILDTSNTSGPAHLKAFPSVERNAVNNRPEHNLRSVLGFYTDKTNGWLWALDMGYVAGETEAPAGAQKIVIYSQRTGRVIKRIPLDSVANRKTSFLNDIVVDERRKIAYVSDSGLRGNDAGLIVVDFMSGKTRRVLDRDTSVQPEKDVETVAEGINILPGYPLRVGINGIALSPDASILYWAVTTGKNAHSISTSALRNKALTDVELAKQVRNLGDVGGNTDGIVTDASGDLYLTDITRSGIVRYETSSKSMSLLYKDERIHWPDTITRSAEGDFFFTSSALHKHFMGSVKLGEERYDVWRLPLLK
ncbi:hypothetical protein GCM10008066_24210 [Oxalicibacterium faecigallinarum]|uniref:Major royal jelly protein n=2 Tax=Oxalicibacterium faecigallinarum TaxID=573741 RepID=A0A8J3F737_9BURK|nr:hypothetical protein GCM10008066_24210 [Oxalicibacterium faecigallinarum]